MKINGITAIQEEIRGDEYIMIFPEVPDDLRAPFEVTTSEGEEVYTVTDFPEPLRKEIDLQTGITAVIFGKLDERDLKIRELEEKLKAEQAFSAMLESFGAGDFAAVLALSANAGGGKDE